MLKAFGNYVNCHDCGKRLKKEESHEHKMGSTEGAFNTPTIIILCDEHHRARYAQNVGETAMKLDETLKGE